MGYDTKLRIAGTDFVTDHESAIQVYDILKTKAEIFSDYSDDMLVPLVDYNLQMSPLDAEFNEDVIAAKTLGVTFGEYYRNKQS